MDIFMSTLFSLTAKIGLLISALAFIGCASAPKVDADYNESYNFSNIKNYYMIPDKEADYLGQPGSSLTDQRIEKAISFEMDKRNLAPVARDQADILISFHITTKDKTRIRNYNMGYSYGSYGGYRRSSMSMGYGSNYGNDISVQQYVEGQLLIDLVDPKTNNVVWRGIASKKIDKNWTNDERIDIINSHVSATMALIPGL